MPRPSRRSQAAKRRLADQGCAAEDQGSTAEVILPREKKVKTNSSGVGPPPYPKAKTNSSGVGPPPYPKAKTNSSGDPFIKVIHSLEMRRTSSVVPSV
ncbi:hypothetical protein JZ751_028499 [Albula glossodonta]|uniref:Uncharacterized protein n=1 Tax=Albula glossodonta TaxID=121402 RepID=A0A8T2MW74_9TELE|nr:hypothetical protein JZ751_030010 [Albula glossodonta]KAG9329733.1 hypothetical protein JZ751_029902 [Albula glossodonta]KAG9329967.1 hypothetical protein JZ751_028499 [Albula glossodonta]